MNTESLQSLMLNDNGFAFHPINGESYQLSETAISIASRDLSSFILTLKNIKLIE